LPDSLAENGRSPSITLVLKTGHSDTHFLALAKTCHDQRPFPLHHFCCPKRPFPTKPFPSPKTLTYQPPLNFQRLRHNQSAGQRIALADPGARRAELAGLAKAFTSKHVATSDRRPSNQPAFTCQARLLPAVNNFFLSTTRKWAA